MVKLTESTVYIRTKASVEAVKKLNLWGCDIDDISICARMTALEVLSLSVNRVESLEPLQYCQKLTELYLRKNNIQSLDELDYLKGLKNLRVLWIDENPCAQNVAYRSRVLKLLPHLTKLDDKPVNPNDLPVSHSEEDLTDSDMYNTIRRNSRNESRMISSFSGNPNELMTRSLYGRTIVDTVMQPQLAHYGDTSDEDRLSTREIAPSKMSSRSNLMSQSVYGALAEDDWGDFNVDEEFIPMSMESITPRMCASMHETLDRSPCRYNSGRSVSVPRRRITTRQQSNSPAREQRLSKIMSAVSTLLDELDHDGLRAVVNEAQSRMKKQR
ncbi:unnamed protein product [Auanema sp. JU1783]|nr:unnamed protein product [Auanema sp. JU1783]